MRNFLSKEFAFGFFSFVIPFGVFEMKFFHLIWESQLETKKKRKNHWWNEKNERFTMTLLYWNLIISLVKQRKIQSCLNLFFFGKVCSMFWKIKDKIKNDTNFSYIFRWKDNFHPFPTSFNLTAIDRLFNLFCCQFFSDNDVLKEMTL